MSNRYLLKQLNAYCVNTAEKCVIIKRNYTKRFVVPLYIFYQIKLQVKLIPMKNTNKF